MRNQFAVTSQEFTVISWSEVYECELLRFSQASPTSDQHPHWIELCNREFNRRYHEQQFGYSRPRVEMPNAVSQDVRLTP